MVIEIDFNSDEAIYVQLCNQIIMGMQPHSFRREKISFCKIRQIR